MSLGRHPPPKPRPGRIPSAPIRASRPSASARTSTSAPAASHTSLMALMKEIFVARNAFAAAFTISAVAKSVTSSGVPARRASA